MNKKKLLTSAVALGTAAVLALGGTFAWQSISQTALNERSDIVNPGGRLHDDFDGSNKDVYVENFADEDIFARIRLEEYFEIVMNYGSDAESVDVLVGDRTVDDETGKITRTGAIFLFDERFNDDGTVKAGVRGDETWWTWTTGGSTVFMPTFNLNKDSLVADINGYYKYTNEITSEDIEGGQYTEMVTYGDGEEKNANAIYDADTNKLDEVTREDVADLIENGTDAENYTTYENNIKLVNETHYAKSTGTTAGLISMAEWLALKDAGEETGNYWVYDTDGWVYWSSPIKADEATGLLLDGIALNQVMDDTWYYAINVVGQFVTANDVGKANSTGFYQDADEAPSTDAETLLEAIGVTIGDTTDDDDDDIIEDIVVVINVDDDADTVSYTLTPDSYAISPVGFGETVTYTVNGAKRCKVTADNKLSISEYESASAFTLTATDEDGNTGTVTVNVTGTTPTDFPVFTIYRVVDGEEYWAGVYTDGETATMDWTAGDTYRVRGDFAAGDTWEYRISLWEMPDGYPSADNSEIYLVEELSWGMSTTIIRAYDPDYDTDTTAEEWTGDTVDVKTTEAAAGNSYQLSLSDNGDSDGYEGVDITVNVKARDEFFTVTDNDGDDTNDPEVVWDSSFGCQTVEYTGTATEFTFAPKDGSAGWKYAFGNAESYWSNNEDGIITISEFGVKIATLDEATGVVTVEAGKLLGQWAQVKAYKDGEEHYIILNGLTNTNSATEEESPLTVEDVMGGEPFDSTMMPGKLLFKVELNGTALKNGENLTAKIYQTGETETPLATWSGDEIEYYAGIGCLMVNLYDKDVTLTDGNNVFDLYVSYDEDGSTVEAEMISLTIAYNPVVLNTAGTATGTAEHYESVLLTLDGVSAPLAGYSVDNSFIGNFRVTLTEGSQEVTFTKGTDSDWVTGGLMDEMYTCDGCSVMFAYKGNVILFWSEEPCTVEITLNGTTYSATFVDAD